LVGALKNQVVHQREKRKQQAKKIFNVFSQSDYECFFSLKNEKKSSHLPSEKGSFFVLLNRYILLRKIKIGMKQAMAL
jgi:hypothetical protein